MRAEQSTAPLLEKDCAVCKEQFNYQAEDPDERIVVSLPCKHPFHEPCIMPWLKSSGTCPVCRYVYLHQPFQHALTLHSVTLWFRNQMASTIHRSPTPALLRLLPMLLPTHRPNRGRRPQRRVVREANVVAPEGYYRIF